MNNFPLRNQHQLLFPASEWMDIVFFPFFFLSDTCDDGVFENLPPPKKQNLFLPCRESCCSHLQESVSGRRSGWLTPCLFVAPEPPDVFGRSWRCIRWHHVTPPLPRPHAPAISHVTVGLFPPKLAKVSIQSDFQLGASCFIFFHSQKLAKKEKKNPTTRIIVKRNAWNLKGCCFQAGDSCTTIVDAAGPPSMKSDPLLAC